MPPGLRNHLEEVGIRPDPDVLERVTSATEAPPAVEVVDVSEFSTARLRSWLEDTELVRANHTLLVWWPGEQVAVTMPRRVLLDRLGDWWYPAQDDLVIAAGGHRLLLDHEETAFLWSPS